MTWITVKHTETNEKISFKYDEKTNQDIKDYTRALLKLDDSKDFQLQLMNDSGKVIEPSQLLSFSTALLELVPVDIQAPLSEKPQFDVLCDGCYTPIRGQRFRCETCEDFDLCSICKSRVNHNPTHQFQLDTSLSKSDTTITEQQQQLPSEAKSTSVTSSTQTIYICDNCDSDIVGIRHTCSSCPDFDLCHSCFSIVKQNHPEQHVFTTHLAGTDYNKKNKKQQVTEATSACDTNIPIQQHTGVQCDHCQSQVVSIRYKCGHCDNFDLCTNCEQNAEQIHDKTHAFIKIRYPIKQLPKQPLLPKFTPFDEVQDTSSSLSSSTATLKSIDTSSASETDETTTKPNEPSILNATLICDMNIPDGTISKPKESFVKIWKVKNSGNVDWPVGSNLEFNGGTMLSFYPNGQPKLFAVPALCPGEETCITAELQAPTSPGHYTSYFCLCTPDGTPFSDNIWCTIIVSSDDPMIFPTPSTENEYDAYEYDSYSTTTGDVSNTTVTYTDSQISCFSPDDDESERYADEESSVHSESVVDDFVIVDEEDGKSPIASSIHSTTTVTPQVTTEDDTPTHSIHQELPLETQVNSLEINDETAETFRKAERALKKLFG